MLRATDLRGMYAIIPTPAREGAQRLDATDTVDLAETARLASERHPLIGPATYNVGRIDGGLGTPIVAADCTVGIDRRMLPGHSVSESVADLHRMLAQLQERRPHAKASRTGEG